MCASSCKGRWHQHAAAGGRVNASQQQQQQHGVGVATAADERRTNSGGGQAGSTTTTAAQQQQQQQQEEGESQTAESSPAEGQGGEVHGTMDTTAEQLTTLAEAPKAVAPEQERADNSLKGTFPTYLPTTPTP